MIVHETQIRVRYGEVDQMGFIYHANYVAFFDVARTQMIRDLGIPNSEIEAAGYMLPVIRVEVNYKNPGHYDDLLTVRTTVKEKPRATMTFDYEVFRENGECITTGSVTLAFMKADTRRACRCPQILLDKLPF